MNWSGTAPARTAVAILMTLLLLTACAKHTAPPESHPAPTPPAPQQAKQPGPATPQSATLFPEQDLVVQFSLQDHDAQQPILLQEQLLHEGDRVVAVQDGKPYTTWLIQPNGIWRTDPHGGGNLLQYLPAVLIDNLTWKQTSGNADVWFHLQHQEPPTCSPYTKLPQGCWKLTVLNRDETTAFIFSAGHGPVRVQTDVWARPSASFSKTLQDEGAGRPDPAQRTAFLNAAPPLATRKELPETATADQFQAMAVALVNTAPGALAHFDLDGDGQVDSVRGTLSAWTKEPITFIRSNGDVLKQLTPHPQKETSFRLTPIQFRKSNHTVFLFESIGGDEPPTLAVLAYFSAYGKPRMESVLGWAIQSSKTRVTRFKATLDGITTEWEMGDPAHHTRIRQYLWVEKGTTGSVTINDTKYVPQNKELVYPATPHDVLLAALEARLYGLTDELHRYFASQAATATLANKELIYSFLVDGTYGVELGEVTPPSPGTCDGKVNPHAIGSDGTVGFYANWGEHQTCGSMWGSVRFDQNGQGLPVIQSLQIEGGTSTGR
jgi:hypothetical protein